MEDEVDVAKAVARLWLTLALALALVFCCLIDHSWLVLKNQLGKLLLSCIWRNLHSGQNKHLQCEWPGLPLHINKHLKSATSVKCIQTFLNSNSVTFLNLLWNEWTILLFLSTKTLLPFVSSSFLILNFVDAVGDALNPVKCSFIVALSSKMKSHSYSSFLE